MWKPNPLNLAVCLEYLKGKGELEVKVAMETLREVRVKEHCLFSKEAYNRLENYINNGEEPGPVPLGEMDGNGHEHVSDGEGDDIAELVEQSP